MEYRVFHVKDISSTGSRGLTWGAPVYTFRLDSDSGYAVLLLIMSFRNVGRPSEHRRGPWRPYGLSLESTALAPLPEQSNTYHES